MSREIPDVKVIFKDGGIGYIPATADGIPLFVGYSSQGSLAANQVVAISSTNKEEITDLLGDTPFTDRIYDFFSAGGNIAYVVKANSNTNADLLTAIQSAVESLLANGNAVFEFISVLTPTDKAFASSLASYLDSLETQDVFVFGIVPVRNINTNETVDDYITNINNEWNGFNSKRVAVVGSYATISNLTGKTREDNIIGLVSGLIAKAKVNQSIGEVMSFPISAISSLAPKGINNGHLNLLNSAGFIVAISYNGKSGYYIARDNIFTSETSDYNNIRNRRVADKASRILRLMLLDYLNINVEAPEGADPSNPPPPEKSPTIYDIKLHLEAGLDSMLQDKEIYGYKVIIPEGQNIWATERLNIKWLIAPNPIIGFISAEHKFFNPLYNGGNK